MPILNLQRRLREAGRIRIGQQVPTSNGKRRPAKLESFRFTSQDHDAIAAIARLYGGTPQRWVDAPVGDQHEVITTSTAIPIFVPPTGMAFSQWNEAWSGGGCTRRCDGEIETVSGEPCLCDAADERICKPTSRLSVILPELQDIGVWRLESHGFYAASELAGSVELLEAAAGRMVPADLVLVQRQVKRIVRGKPETYNFAVPGIRPRVSVAELAIGGSVGVPVQQLAEPSAGALPAGPGFTPVDVAALPPAPVATVAEQVAAPGRQRRAGGARAAEPIKATGVKPKPRGAPPSDDEAPPPTDEDLPTSTPLRTEQRLAMLAREAGITDDDERHQLYELLTGQTSGRTMNPKQQAVVERVLARIKAGGATLDDYRFAVTFGSPAGEAIRARADEVGAVDHMVAWFDQQGMAWPLTQADVAAVNAELDRLASTAATEQQVLDTTGSPT